MMPRWLLPQNISDSLPLEAGRNEGLRRRLLDRYRASGYELLAPPLIENLESLLTGSGSRLATRTFQTVDQLSGRTLGVRADITPQAARIDAHLLNRSGVARLCYAGSVLHTRPSHPLATREPLQVGAELFGHAGVEAELEVLELMVESLQLLGVSAVRIDLGHARIVPALLADAEKQGWPADPLDLDELYGLLVQKDVTGLSDFLRDCPQPAKDGLMALIDLYGSVKAGSTEVLELARTRLPAIDGVVQALDLIEGLICSTLWMRLSGVELSIDLADLQGYHYYSGVSFTAFAMPQLNEHFHGEALARGGRYDGVGQVFGRDRAAVGFSLDLRTVAAIGQGSASYQSVAAISAPWRDDTGLRHAIAKLRDAGEIVVQTLPGHQNESRALNCDRELIQLDEEWVVQDLAQQ